MANPYWIYNGTMQNDLGVRVVDGLVYVCTQPANTTTTPPSPLATLFADPNGVTPLANPVSTAENGNYSFYAAPGLYTVVETSPSTSTFIKSDQAIGLAAGSEGNVSSVAVTGDGVIFNTTIPGSPITSTGDIDFSQAIIPVPANFVLAGPTSGANANPLYRKLVAADIPGSGPAWNNILSFGASNLGTGVAPEAANMTSGSPILSIVVTSAGTVFSAQDVGKTVQVVGAGTGGADLFSTIISFTNSLQVTLAANAGTTVGSAYAFWYPAGKDDTAAIQAAINNCSGTSSIVYIPAGVYVISAPLVMTNNCLGLYGDNWFSSWIVVSSASFANNGLDYSQVSVRLTGPQILNIGLKGPGLANAPGLISNAQVTSNVVTFTETNSYVNGTKRLVFGFTNSLLRILNNIEYTVLSSTGTTWTASITTANIVSTGDNAASLPSISGANWPSVRYAAVNNFIPLSWPGAGFITRDVIVSTLANIVAQHCGAGVAMFQQTTAAAPSLGTISGTSVNLNSVYGNGSQTFGFYAFQLVYSSLQACAGDANKVAYFFDTCQAVAVNGAGCEGTEYLSAAFPGDAFRIFHSQAIQLNSVRAFWNSSSDARSQAVRYINANRCSAFNLESIVAGSGGVAPTTVFSYDAASQDNTMWEPQFDVSGTSAWTDAGTNNNVFYGGTWHTNLRVATGVFPILSTPNFINSPTAIAADFAIAGFGGAATISNVAGSNASGNIQITAATGGTASPTVTFTYHTGDTFSVQPVIIQSRFDSSITEVGDWQLTAKTTTSCTWTLVGVTPVSGHVYGLAWFLAAKQ